MKHSKYLVLLAHLFIFQLGCDSGDSNTDSNSDLNSDTDSDSDNDTDVDTDSDSDSDSDTDTDTHICMVTISGEVRVSKEIGSGEGLLCIGMLEEECPDDGIFDPSFVYGVEIPKVTLLDSKEHEPFEFAATFEEMAAKISNGVYGLGAVLAQSEDADSCAEQVSGDLFGCVDLDIDFLDNKPGCVDFIANIDLDFQVP